MTGPAPALPDNVTLAAADGSQIYPDRHGLAFYYAINVATIVMRQGSGLAPEVMAQPQLFYSEEDVYPAGQPAAADLVGARRGLAEISALADHTLGEPLHGPPRIALADGPLLIWLQRAALSDAQREEILRDYLACLDRMRAGRAPVAGFVSRPQSAEVVALLWLGLASQEGRIETDSLHRSQYRGVSDRTLFSALMPGERSALFLRGTAANRDFGARGHAIHFFYLNTGTDIARVEVPEWVADRTADLELVHAAVYDQCRFNRGYPYLLSRADEEAVIMTDERNALEDMIVQALTRQGLLPPELSRKAQQKQIARWRRRR
jgi:hypothetical protein